MAVYFENCFSYCQRYHFETESQLFFDYYITTNYCFSYCQRYHFETESQQISSTRPLLLIVLAIVKDTILKPNHNKVLWLACIDIIVLAIVKDTILKPNHNLLDNQNFHYQIVLAIVKDTILKPNYKIKILYKSYK